MRWIEKEDEFHRIRLEAKRCVYVDSGREPTTLRRLTFDDAEICTKAFAQFLQHLMDRSGDTKAYYMVLDPDPVHYFNRLFKRYPLVEITHDDPVDTYIAVLNEPPNGNAADGNAADDIGTNWWRSVILVPSQMWFIHAMRSARDEGGHLWIPKTGSLRRLMHIRMRR